MAHNANLSIQVFALLLAKAVEVPQDMIIFGDPYVFLCRLWLAVRKLCGRSLIDARPQTGDSPRRKNGKCGTNRRIRDCSPTSFRSRPSPWWRRKFGGNHRRRNLRLIETKPKPVVSATVEITPCRRIARRQRRTYCWVPIGTTASRPVYERRSAGSSN